MRKKSERGKKRARGLSWGWFLLAFCRFAQSQEANAYITWEGAEPDKGASAWYIQRYVNPHAQFRVVPYQASLGAGIAFDVPQAKYRRTQNSTAFEMLLLDYPSTDSVVQRMAQIIHDIEINSWGVKRYPQSMIIERKCAQIADRYLRRSIPMSCFAPFFDSVYAWIAKGSAEPDLLVIPRQCPGDVSLMKQPQGKSTLQP